VSKRAKGGAAFGGAKGHGTVIIEEGSVVINEGPVEDVVLETRLPDDFKVVPIYHCACSHSTRANGFCKHGNNL
jgi:hypothetical protein